MTSPLYVLMKRGYYYRPEARGYTADINEAWRVQKNEAELHCHGTHGEVTMHLLSDEVSPYKVGERITIHELELAHIEAIVKSTETLDEAAQILGIDIATLYRKRKRHGLPMRNGRNRR